MTPTPSHEQEFHALLVEDNLINRRLISRLLTSKGLFVTDVKDAEEALSRYQTQSFDIVFIDVFLPDTDGKEAVKQLRQMDGIGSEIPIVALTTDKTLQPNELFQDVLKKPLSEDALSRILNTHLGQEEESHDDVLFDQDEFETFYQDNKLRREIIQLLLNDPKSSLNSIEYAYESKDLDVIYDQLHYLKASFNYLKAFRLVTIVQEILDWCKADKTSKVLASEEHFLATYRVLRDTLRTYLNTLES